MTLPQVLLVVGFGYSGRAIASRAARCGFCVLATVRKPPGVAVPPGIELIGFDDAAPYAMATHIVATAAPGPEGDPVWHRHREALQSTAARWIGYISTTGVYGDRGGNWVDETSPPIPGMARSLRRLAAERQWEELSARCSVALFRTGGIYGPTRSVLDDVRDGSARCVSKPGHAFSRIHRDDIARAVVASMQQPTLAGRRVFHLVDDEPAEAAEVTREAARLIGVEPPPEVAFETAQATMSDMGRSFWAENRRVSNTLTKAALGLEWAYPTFREGLRAIVANERAQDASK